MREWKIFARTGIVAVFVVLSIGCSKQSATEPFEQPDFPPELASIQGTWVSATTNGCTDNCGVIIEGYTIRLRYQESPDAPMVRHSVSIEQINVEQQLVVLAGGGGAWPYFYGIQEGTECLEIEFFSQEHKKWQRMNLRRKDNEQS